ETPASPTEPAITKTTGTLLRVSASRGMSMATAGPQFALRRESSMIVRQQFTSGILRPFRHGLLGRTFKTSIPLLPGRPIQGELRALFRPEEMRRKPYRGS